MALALLSQLGARCLAEPLKGTVARTIKVGELSRTYYLHRPARLQANKPAALVLVFHGSGGTALQIERHTAFSQLADREGFLVAYPEGIGRSWNDGRMAPAIAAQRNEVDDLGFITALIDDLARSDHLDAKRLYATGISNGGIFAQLLGARLSARFAAIAPVAGGLAEPQSASFQPQRPVSVLILQGTNDPLMPYEGGAIGSRSVGKRGRIISTDDVLLKWVNRNGANPQPLIKDLPDTNRQDGCRVTTYTYTGGMAGTDVVLYRLNGGGHTWPGAHASLPKWLVGNTCADIDATRVIWDFFKAHPRP